MYVNEKLNNGQCVMLEQTELILFGEHMHSINGDLIQLGQNHHIGQHIHQVTFVCTFMILTPVYLMRGVDGDE